MLINSGHCHDQCLFQIWRQFIQCIWSYRVHAIYIKGDPARCVKIAKIMISQLRKKRSLPVRLTTHQGAHHTEFHFKILNMFREWNFQKLL